MEFCRSHISQRPITSRRDDASSDDGTRPEVPHQRQAIPALSKGSTPTERYLARLAARSFLSLWSYPGVYRDQGKGGRGDGKELCDLLVVFGRHVIIFSDKDIQYGTASDPGTNWNRWYKRAVEKSANQIWGAERWIREFPSRLFLDRRCTKPFPLPLSSNDDLIVHRVVVAHDSSGRRGSLIGGSGSLIIRPEISGAEHLVKPGTGSVTFAIGQPDPDRGFVHVLDDSSLALVMSELDTISDFVAYLTKKERFIKSGRLGMAAGEEELLGFYKKNVNEQGEHDFVVPPNGDKVVLGVGHWSEYSSSDEYRTKQSADRPSYAWDELIEKTAGHLVGDTLYLGRDLGFGDGEKVLRYLAREPRLRRRALVGALLEKLHQTPKGELGARVISPSASGYPCYVFLFVPADWGDGPDDNRLKRAQALRAYCSIAKATRAGSADVVGFATESGASLRFRSEDFALLEDSKWTNADTEEAIRLQSETGILSKVEVSPVRIKEYAGGSDQSASEEVGRNAPCPCGSGKKYKKCCGNPAKRRKPLS